jgi:hypothetical protein
MASEPPMKRKREELSFPMPMPPAFIQSNDFEFSADFGMSTPSGFELHETGYDDSPSQPSAAGPSASASASSSQPYTPMEEPGLDSTAATHSGGGGSSALPQTPTEVADFSDETSCLTFEEGEAGAFVHAELNKVSGFLCHLGAMEPLHQSLIAAFQLRDFHQLRLIAANIESVLADVMQCLSSLEALLSAYIFSPIGLSKAASMSQQITNKVSQLRVWQTLLHLSVRNEMSHIFHAELVITNQPFPIVVTKGKQFDGSFVDLTLVVGGGVSLISCSNLFLECIEIRDDPSGSEPQQLVVPLEDSTLPVTLDALIKGVKWALRFSAGTRKNLMKCRFSVQIMFSRNGESVTQTFFSPFTEPFVVITNESQWDECEGDLLTHLLFPNAGVTTVRWPAVVNHLQKFILRATRQPSPTFFLSRPTLHFLFHKFFRSDPNVTREDFVTFWRWFGKTMHKLRYQRHLCSLYVCGFLHLLIPREVAVEILLPHSPGAFLVRFSESNAGALVVSYKTDDVNRSKCIRHYLVSPADLTGAKKSLPDFLMSQPSLVYLYQHVVSMDGNVTGRFYHKNDALDPYLSKRVGSQENVGDYDEKMV